jgi:putative redox protein
MAVGRSFSEGGSPGLRNCEPRRARPESPSPEPGGGYNPRMSDPAVKPPTVAELVWNRDLILSGTSGKASIVLDSAGLAGPSPVQTLAFALAGCMAMDVVHVIRKGRHRLRGCRVELVGQRAPKEPRRFTAIALRFSITGNVPREAVDRAIELSREKYCSVWHSMRQDISLTVTASISPASPSTSGGV